MCYTLFKEFVCFKDMIFSDRRGFTLIELITAFGILAVLATMVIVTINPLEQYRKSNDGRRKSDLAQIQRGLEAYYQDNGRYPQSSGDEITGAKWGKSWTPYMNVLPIDRGGFKYAYYSSGQQYLLFAHLERGGRDPQACKSDGLECNGASFLSTSNACGGTCNYGVSSPNTSP